MRCSPWHLPAPSEGESMDQNQFDRWSQSFASVTVPSRRGLLRSAAGLAIVGLLGHDAAVAQRHRKRKQKEKTSSPPPPLAVSPSPPPPLPPPPVPAVCPATCPTCETCDAAT